MVDEHLIQGEEHAYKPFHRFQNWETFNPETDYTVESMDDYMYQDEWHAVYTVQLGELIQSGVFDWSRDILDWREAAYSPEQYERFCKYFEERFRFREISIIPPLEWFYALRRKLVYELMPKYVPMYKAIDDGINPLATEDEYLKRRHITSNYPETLLSGNSDYITTGDDEEYERVKYNTVADGFENYITKFSSVDEKIADELEVLFISMYTSYVNGL